MQRSTNDSDQHLSLLRDRITRLFDAAVTRTDSTDDGGDPAHWSPLVDLYETEEQVVLVAEVPGLSMDDLDVQVTDSTLTLKGNRRLPARPGGEGKVVQHRVERAHGTFSRSFQLAAAIDRDQVTAEYRHGLLRVVLPKQRKAKPRSIRVNKS